MRKILSIIGLVFISLLAVAFLFPNYWTHIGSLRVGTLYMKMPPDFLPSSPSLKNYATILLQGNFPRWVLNTLVITVCSTVLGVSVACLAGYAFAKKQFPFKNLLFWTVMATIMISLYVTLIPLFITMKSLGLHNTYPGIFLPSMAAAGSMFLARQYMSTIPSQFIDSARVDGANELQIFLYIIVPICKPLIAVLCIFGLIGGFRSYLWPLVMTSSDETRTLVVAMATIAARPGGMSDVGLAMAGASLIMIPIYAIFFSFQKYFVKGITLGGIKG